MGLSSQHPHTLYEDGDFATSQALILRDQSTSDLRLPEASAQRAKPGCPSLSCLLSSPLLTTSLHSVLSTLLHRRHFDAHEDSHSSDMQLTARNTDHSYPLIVRLHTAPKSNPCHLSHKRHPLAYDACLPRPRRSVRSPLSRHKSDSFRTWIVVATGSLVDVIMRAAPLDIINRPAWRNLTCEYHCSVRQQGRKL